MKRMQEPTRYPGEKRTPKRPEGGFGLLVTPKGNEMDEPFVAKRDGSRRALTQEEYDEWIRQYPQSFRKKVERVRQQKQEKHEGEGGMATNG